MTAHEADCGQALESLIRGTKALNISLTIEQRDQFSRFCATLLAANRTMNLTAIRDPDGVMRTLFLDSLTICLVLPTPLTAATTETVLAVDLGSGAGIPGIPLKILYPHWSLVLVESIRKKARFLHAVVSEIGLEDVRVLPERAEELVSAPQWRDRAHLCLARAVGPLSSLVELCAPFVRPGGLLVFPKSGNLEYEISEAHGAMTSLRVRLREILEVPGELGLGPGRAIVACDKFGPTPSRFPRRVGLARSQPIGQSAKPARRRPAP